MYSACGSDKKMLSLPEVSHYLKGVFLSLRTVAGSGPSDCWLFHRRTGRTLHKPWERFCILINNIIKQDLGNCSDVAPIQINHQNRPLPSIYIYIYIHTFHTDLLIDSLCYISRLLCCWSEDCICSHATACLNKRETTINRSCNWAVNHTVYWQVPELLSLSIMAFISNFRLRTKCLNALFASLWQNRMNEGPVGFFAIPDIF